MTVSDVVQHFRPAGEMRRVHAAGRMREIFEHLMP